MLRQARASREGERDSHGFRIRGREVTRLEGFSDAVFAFALTLLVVSLEVPKTFGELMETMRGFVAFGVCFALLAMIWNHHYVYSRRFGLEDGTEHTLEEVGQNFAVTRVRIRQIEAKALRKLRHPSRSRRLRAFLDGTGRD